MMALTLTQPWASLVAIGAKRYETRSWRTNHRGPLAIHAAKGFPRDCQLLAYKNEPFSSVLHAGGFTNLRSLMDVCGQILCVVDLVDCMRTQGYPPRHWLTAPTQHEHAFGDYTAGRFAWPMMNVRRLKKPIAAKGALNVWPMPADLVAAVMEQLP